jgi:hypothetical protein
VLLQALADRQIGYNRDTELTEIIGRTYARSHEDGWTPISPGRQDDEVCEILFAGYIDDADRSVSFQQHAVDFDAAFVRDFKITPPPAKSE